MANVVQRPSAGRIAALVTWFVDVRRLINHLLTMVKQEVWGELRNTLHAALSLTAAIGITLTGSLFSLLMLSPVLPRWVRFLPSLWACNGLVGGACLVGRSRLSKGL
jgi:hypothetical protein